MGNSPFSKVTGKGSRSDETDAAQSSDGDMSGRVYPFKGSSSDPAEGSVAASPENTDELRERVFRFAANPEAFPEVVDPHEPLPDQLDKFIRELVEIAERLETPGGGHHTGDPLVDAKQRQYDKALLGAGVEFLIKALLCPGADYYRVLGVQLTAPAQQIHDHYRALQQLFWQFEGDEFGQGSVMRLNEAYLVLRDFEKRQAYDEKLVTELDQALPARDEPSVVAESESVEEPTGKDAELELEPLGGKSEPDDELARDPWARTRDANAKPEHVSFKPPTGKLQNRKLNLETLREHRTIALGALLVVLLLAVGVAWFKQAEILDEMETIAERAPVTVDPAPVVEAPSEPSQEPPQEEISELPATTTDAEKATSSVVAQPTSSATAPPLADSRVAALLATGAAQYQDDKLTQPDGDNALETYRQVLALEPDNINAASGLELIADRYVGLAYFRLNRKNYTEALDMIERGLSAVPAHKRLLQLKVDAEAKLAAATPPKTAPAPSAKSEAEEFLKRKDALAETSKPSPTASEQARSESATMTSAPTVPAQIESPVAPAADTDEQKTVSPVEPAPQTATLPEAPTDTAATSTSVPGIKPAPVRGITAGRLNVLIADFVELYELGDVDKFITLFAERARTNSRVTRNGIYEDYYAFFRDTASRLMRLRDVRWTIDKNSALGDGDFVLTIVKPGETKSQSFEGTLTFQVIEENDRLVIKSLYHTQRQTAR